MSEFGYPLYPVAPTNQQALSSITGTTTLGVGAATYSKHFFITGAGGYTITLPALDGVNFPTGSFSIFNNSSALCTINAAGADTMLLLGASYSSVSILPGERFLVQNMVSNWIIGLESASRTTTAPVGDNSIRTASTAFAQTLAPVGQCRLTVQSTTSLLLSPYNGNNIVINGSAQQIPAAGITVSNAGLQAQIAGSSFSITSNVCTYITGAAHNLIVGARVTIQNSVTGYLNGNWTVASVTNSTTFTFAVTAANVASTPDVSALVRAVYYVYVGMVSGTMTLSISQSQYTFNTTGLPVNSANAAQTLVGMCTVSTGPNFVASGGNWFLLNWFNRRPTMVTTGGTPGTTFTNTGSTVEITSAIRLNFLTWADDVPLLTVAGTFQQNTASAGISSSLAIDALSNVYSPVQNQSFPFVNATSGFCTSGSYTAGNEGFHATLFTGSVSSNQGTLVNIRKQAIIQA